MEFALVLPFLMVVIAGIVDFGFWLQRYEVVTNAAREGARIAVLPNYGETVIKARVRSYVQEGLDLTDAALNQVLPLENITVTNVDQDIDVGGGAVVTVPTAQVDVVYEHRFLLIGPMLAMIGGSFGTQTNVVASSRMRLEVPAAGS